MVKETVEFLQRLPIFEELTPSQLAAMAYGCEHYSFQRGAIIAYQRDVADRLYIVRSGRLEAFEMDQNGVVAASRRYMPGDYFEDEWLIAPDIHKATIRAASDGELLAITHDSFIRFSERYPDATFDLSERAWEVLNQTRLSAEAGPRINQLSLLPGEIVEFESRRTALILVVELFLPLVIFIVLMVAWPLIGLDLATTRSAVIRSSLAIFSLFHLINLGWGLYRLIDWYNDYFVITNKHIVHKEYNLRSFAGEIAKIPFDQIQSINVLRPNLLQTILRVGTVEVTTAAANRKVRFDNIRNPHQIEQTVTRLRNRERVLDESRMRAGVRRSLEQYFQVPEETRPVATAGSEEKSGSAPRTVSRRPRRRGPRYEEGDVITYGRHWFVIIKRAWWLILLLLLTVSGMVAGWYSDLFPLSRIIVIPGVVILLVQLVGLFLYYEDWQNDVYQLTRDTVIDIRRSNLRFAETRKTATLNNIQDVRAVTPNLIATILRYGHVYVDTAGATANMVFLNVYNPNAVQAEIFERRDQLRERLRVQDAVSRRQELTLILDEYQQLREQKRIPRRTPPLDAAVGE